MLKLFVDDVSTVDEAHRGLYEKGEDGKYALQVEGAVPKAKLDEFRNKNIELMQTAEKFKGIDPAKYAELQDLQRKVDESKLVGSDKIDEAVTNRVKTLEAEYQTKIEEINGKYQGAQSALEKTMLSSELQSRALKAGAHESALDDIQSRARQIYKLVDNQIVPLDSNGQVVYGRNGSDPMPMSEWLKGLAKDAPHLFKGSNGGGSNNTGKGGGDRSKMTAAQKISAGLS